ncbi:MAG: purine phosphorylase [Rhodospirillales bacterium]
MLREADCLRVFPVDRRPLVRSVGANAAGARDAARELLLQGCRGLLSFGLAGGIAPALTAGALIIPKEVVAADGRRFIPDAAWLNGLHAKLAKGIDINVSSLAGSDQAVTTTTAKRALRESTGAVAVDMESHAVADLASASGVPFLVVRAVADAYDRTVPEWIVNKGVGENGRSRPLSLLAALALRPRALPALIALAGDSRKAIATLRRVALLAGPGFGFG